MSNVIEATEAKHAKLIWHNPVTDKIYIGTNYTSSGPEPTYEQPVFNMKVARSNVKLIKEGKAKRDELANPWAPEFNKLAEEYNTLRTAAVKGDRLRIAATGTNSDFSTINIVNVMTKVLGLEFPNRVAIESVMSIDTPSTLLSVDVGTPFEGHAQATETYTPEPQRQTFTRTTFDLPVDYAIFGLTDQAQLKASHNLFQLGVENAPRVLRKIENKTVVAVIETAGTSAKGDWSAVSSGLSTRSPRTDIVTALNTISGNGGDLSDFSILMHNTVWTNYADNTFVRGAYNRPFQSIGGTGRVVQDERIPGASIYIDNDATATVSTIYTKDAFVRANGPTLVAQWRDEWRMTEQYRAAHFCQTKKMQSGRSVKLTSVS